ncbi:MAG TPA: hypothetical protein VMM38_07555 [Aridibacter sp.]|nr:hypothetical protein [Aridibacter sp.]
MAQTRSNSERVGEGGYSLPELITAVTISLIILAAVVAAFSGALRTRERQSSRTDAITSTQAAINIVSREVSNSGYGLTTNGIVLADSNDKQIHFRSNLDNTDTTTSDAGEDITIFYDANSQSVLRYDANTGVTSGVINRVSDVDFLYYSNSFSGETGPFTVPSAETTRVNIRLKVLLPNVQSQPASQETVFVTDVTLRNAPYMRSQY